MRKSTICVLQCVTVKKWLAALENEERESTGISKLKVGYNKVFGYYIEVTKSAIKRRTRLLYKKANACKL